MLLTKRLTEALLQTNASVLLLEGYEDKEKNKPVLCIRKVVALYGKYEETGKKGGILTDSPAGADNRFPYHEILGYFTGHEASIQQLILFENIWSFKTHIPDWSVFLKKAASMLLESREIENEKLSVESLTEIRYRYKDNWYGNIHRFVKLNDAKKCAEKETGTSITIFTSVKGETLIAATVKASGYCYP